MNILLVGDRAIQNALAVRLRNEGNIVSIYPGQNVDPYSTLKPEDLKTSDFDLIVNGSARFFLDRHVLALKEQGVAYFGPSPDQAQLELSKSHFNSFCNRHHIRRPLCRRLETIEDAEEWIQVIPHPHVVKEIGPAGGCGVHILKNAQDLKDLAKNRFGTNGPALLIEEFIDGFEVAVNVLVDGDHHFILPPTAPHKRRNNLNMGPLVAGMGSVAPVPLNSIFYQDLSTQVIEPLLRGICQDGEAYKGNLFLNLMITSEHIYVLECNTRMGDPAMLVDLLMLKSSLTELLVACTQGSLPEVVPEFHSGTAVAVTLVLPEYPFSIDTEKAFQADPRHFWDGRSSGGLIPSAASLQGKILKPNGGVVAVAIARGSELDQALTEAYQLCALLPDLDRRNDIGRHLSVSSRYSLSSHC